MNYKARQQASLNMDDALSDDLETPKFFAIYVLAASRILHKFWYFEYFKGYLFGVHKQ